MASSTKFWTAAKSKIFTNLDIQIQLSNTFENVIIILYIF